MKQIFAAVAALFLLAPLADAQTSVRNPDGSVTVTVPHGMTLPQFPGELERVEITAATGSTYRWGVSMDFEPGPYQCDGNGWVQATVSSATWSYDFDRAHYSLPFNGSAPRGGESRTLEASFTLPPQDTRVLVGAQVEPYEGRRFIPLVWEDASLFSPTLHEGQLSYGWSRYFDVTGIALEVRYVPVVTP